MVYCIEFIDLLGLFYLVIYQMQKILQDSFDGFPCLVKLLNRGIMIVETFYATHSDHGHSVSVVLFLFSVFLN